MNARDIILAPVITEKAVSLLPEKKYTFRVADSANKIEIANVLIHDLNAGKGRH